MNRPIWHHDLVRARRSRRLLTLAVLLLVVLPMAVGCVRIKASLTVSPDDRVSGQIVAAAKPRDDNDTGPQFDENLPFAQKVAISPYSKDDFVGSQAVFADLSFAELPQLTNMNGDAAGADLSLRRAGDLVILEGRVDLTSLSDPEADVELSVTFPGEVTSTNGERISNSSVQWILKPGVVNTMSAQARFTDPSTRSFKGGAWVMGISALLVSAIVGTLAWLARDRSARLGAPSEPD